MHSAHEVADRVIAKAAISPQVLRRVVADLRDEMWPTPEHLALFRALRALALEGAPVEIMTLYERLPKDAGLAAKVCQLLEEPTAADADYWIARFLDAWRERSLGELLERCDVARQGTQPWAEREQQIVGLMRDWAAGHPLAGSGIVALRDLLAEAALSGWQHGPQSGIAGWDELLGGFTPGRLHVVAGRPGTGKTTLAIRVAERIGQDGIASVLVPLEMGELPTAEWCSAMGVPAEAPIFVVRTPDRRWPFVRRWLEAACEQHRPALLVLDHLGYLTWPRRDRREENRVLEVGQIIRDLKQLAQERQTGVLLISHLNRAIEHRKGGRPVLADLRDSGEIEQEADSVTFLWSDAEHRRAADVPCWLTVEKHRHGPPGDVPVWFHRPSRTFRAREP